MTILIADDSARMRAMLRALVVDIGDDIHECADGASAVALYDEHRPRWVLMDVAMEPMDGLAATAAIVALDPNACVAIVTDHDDDRTRRAALDAGARVFVPKERLLQLPLLLATEPGDARQPASRERDSHLPQFPSTGKSQ